jgi:hypothetical protein
MHSRQYTEQGYETIERNQAAAMREILRGLQDTTQESATAVQDFDISGFIIGTSRATQMLRFHHKRQVTSSPTPKKFVFAMKESFGAINHGSGKSRLHMVIIRSASYGLPGPRKSNPIQTQIGQKFPS